MSDILELIKSRRSVKKYKSDPVPKEMIEKIVQAGMHAPTGRNWQSPIILAITNKEIRDKIAYLNFGFDSDKRIDPFYGAPCVLVVLADKSKHTYIYDGSLVMGNMLLEAHSLGLGACWIHRAKETFASEEGKAILKQLGIDGDYEGIGNCIVGYPDMTPVDKPRKENWVYWVE